MDEKLQEIDLNILFIMYGRTSAKRRSFKEVHIYPNAFNIYPSSV
jgi:hypothetical protein